MASGQEDGGEHERHLREFGNALTQAWDKKGHAHGAEQEADTEHDTEVERGRGQDPTTSRTSTLGMIHGA
ncbi:hypothetical protein BN874_1920005 [Candidatus Contendobacter odensis Run_B_J11]|uniref:Uncharacterized protein n=1 Tax=Candidatus Contendobacter odensis Run_B_J11 TaxID=1400861 RepID=A0A7U7GB16_9GAMM|nr:hypothetical protein BN874_1920005 [Candidatus Contendobacter odensis Run_B_J11]